MTSTEHQPRPADPAVDPVSEQRGLAGVESAADLVEGAQPTKPVAADAAPEVSEGLAAPLLVAWLGGMALVLAILTPITGVRIGGLVIGAVAVAIVGRLLARRGGGTR